MKTKEELVKKYVENEEEIKRLNKENYGINVELKQLYEHKVGEIAKLTKVGRKNVGSAFFPKRVEINGEERLVVLVSVKPVIDTWKREPELFHKPIFHPIKKDGGVSKNGIYIGGSDVVWTGEIHKDYQNK